VAAAASVTAGTLAVNAGIGELKSNGRVPVRPDRVAVGELDGDDERRTWRAMITNIKLIEECELSFPIILSARGAVMDGMHRVAKAILLGREES